MRSYVQDALDRCEALSPVRSPLAQASPEDIFLAWLVGLPDGTDIAAAARDRIIRLDEAGFSSEPARKLRGLLEQAADSKKEG